MFNGQKIVATIEARMTSSRLPGKVLMDFVGKPSLQHIIERLKRSRWIDEVVVATTVNETDNEIVKLCDSIGCKYFRGSEEDVLVRVLDTAKSVNADIIVEITGDCPCVDWRLCDRMIEFMFSDEYDYVANDLEKSFPIGFGIEVFKVSVLDEVNTITQSPVDREHVSLYIYTHPEKYKLGNLVAEKEVNYPDLEVTLDNKEDYSMIKKIYETLYPQNNDFTMQDVINLMLRDTDLKEIVSGVTRKDPFQEKEMWEKNNGK